MVSISIFWFSVFFIFYTYFGYPLVLFILSILSPKPIRKNSELHPPFVSIVIAAKNEAVRIEKRLKNLLAQEYPSDKLEIIVVSDGSTDATQNIVEKLVAEQRFGQPSISCYAYSPSKGKPTALNLGIEKSVGEIIIFADSRQQFEKNTVLELVANFADPLIGGVSGELVFLEDGESQIKMQMGIYWNYEKIIRKLESKSGSVVGATGAIYAIRKNLFQPLPTETILDDVLTPLNIVMQGYRIVFDGKAVAYDFVSQDVKQEWQRKVRTLSGNWQLISLRGVLVNPLKNRLLLRFFSHKIARLLVPLFLVLLLISSTLQHRIFYKFATIVQFILYCTAMLAYLFPQIQRYGMVKTIFFFCSLNLAALVGFFVWLTGGCATVWSAGDPK